MLRSSALIKGHRVRRIREALGLTQPELGALLGVHFTTVCRWETGLAALGPTPFLTQLIETFGQAAKRRPTPPGDELRRVLHTGGAMRALCLLLGWAFERPRRMTSPK